MKAVIVYADESGTHDPCGIQKGSAYPIIAGFAAPPSEWSKFCVKWQAVLNAYAAPYLHSRELRAAKAALEKSKPLSRSRKPNPFGEWDIGKIDRFLLTLGRIAGDGNKVLIQGGMNIHALNRFKAKLSINNPEGIDPNLDPYEGCLGQFFNDFHRETFRRWGKFKCNVTFLFDHHDDPKWRSAVHQLFESFKTKDSRMQELSFVNKLQCPHLPLQAADLVAYRLRQVSQKAAEKTFDLTPLDDALFSKLAKRIRRTPLYEDQGGS